MVRRCVLCSGPLMEDDMSAAVAAGGAAAAAAAELARQEEEEMTPYSSKDLAEDWEFKILRSATNGFRDPAWLNAVLREEARAGWTLVEKFDDGRVRLKRPAAARAKDASLGFDPYRTWAGMSQQRLAGIIVGAIFGGMAVIGFAVALVVMLTRAKGLH
jgi:hypothetical protein